MRATYEGGFIRDVYQGECTTSEVRGWKDEVREVREWTDGMREVRRRRTSGRCVPILSAACAVPEASAYTRVPVHATELRRV